MFGVDDPCTEAAIRTYVKLMRASHAIGMATAPRLAEAGLTHTQLGVLEALLHLGPLSQGDLSRKILTSPGNLTDVIDKLAKRDLVERVRCPNDRRSVRVVLTDAGRCFIERLFPGHAHDIARAMAGVTGADLATLDRLLRRLGTGTTATNAATMRQSPTGATS